MPTPCERRARFRQSLVALVPVLLGFLTARPCPATDGPAPPELWEFRLTASVMSADYDGTTEFTVGQTVGGNFIRGELDYSTVYPDPQPLYLVDLAASNGEWGASLRGQYLEWDNLVALANWTQLEETTWYLEADVSHSVGTHWWAFLGVRYFEFDLSLQVMLDPPLPQLPPLVTGQDWFDPLAGASFLYPLGRRWELAGRGDIGGFGVGSELSWNLEATIQWSFANHVALVGGYRVFDVDFEEDRTYTLPDGGETTLPDTYDTRTEGPTLGLTFHW